MEMSIPELSQDGLGEWSNLRGREWNVEAGAEGRAVQAEGMWPLQQIQRGLWAVVAGRHRGELTQRHSEVSWALRVGMRWGAPSQCPEPGR